MARQAGAVVGMLFLAHAAAAQFIQQGGKLVGTGAVGAAHQGGSVAISADGNTAIVGGYRRQLRCRRRVGVHAQRGGVVAAGQQAGRHRRRRELPARAARSRSRRTGTPPSSAGPSTTAMPAPRGCSRAAAACGRSRAASWSAPAPSGPPARAPRWRSRRTGTPPSSVGRDDNSGTGAAWVFTRSGGVWSQQGSKLVGTGAVGAAEQGCSVAISADGNTAIVGGSRRQLRCRRRVGVHAQRRGVVAAGQQAGRHGRRRGCLAGLLGGDLGGREHRHRRRVRRQLRCRRRVGVHAQRGGVVAAGEQAGRHGRRRGRRARASRSRSRRTGTPPSSAGHGDNSDAGAAWVFTRSGGVWSQQGSKLVGTGAVGAAAAGLLGGDLGGRQHRHRRRARRRLTPAPRGSSSTGAPRHRSPPSRRARAFKAGRPPRWASLRPARLRFRSSGTGGLPVIPRLQSAVTRGRSQPCPCSQRPASGRVLPTRAAPPTQPPQRLRSADACAGTFIG